MFGFDIKVGMAAFALWLGLVATPSAIMAGLFIALLVYSVSVILMGKRPGWRIIIGFCLTIFIAGGLGIIAPGLPYLMGMPIQGAMGLGGIVAAMIYPARKPKENLSWFETAFRKGIENAINKFTK